MVLYCKVTQLRSIVDVGHACHWYLVCTPQRISIKSPKRAALLSSKLSSSCNKYSSLFVAARRSSASIIVCSVQSAKWWTVTITLRGPCGRTKDSFSRGCATKQTNKMSYADSHKGLRAPEPFLARQLWEWPSLPIIILMFNTNCSAWEHLSALYLKFFLS